jgi:hypothetical protein
MKNQAILTYFNNTKHNLLLKWESLEGADHVATTYLTPDVKVVTS